MSCKLNSAHPPTLHTVHKIKLASKRSNFLSSSSPILHSKARTIASCSYSKQSDQETATQTPPPGARAFNVAFQTLDACKLGISRYPDFEYNANGGNGTATGTKKVEPLSEELWVSFDPKALYIPPLTSSTTRFLGLPLPPFLKIEITPELLQGTVNQGNGKVELQFRAMFWFSVGKLYRAPPLVVETTLTSEESKGTMRSGRGERMDGEGRCRLVGVAVVDPINDVLMNSFLGLPTECIAYLNAIISISSSS